MSTLQVLYTTHPDKECAQHMTKLLLEKRLVACGNIYPIESHYWWEDKIESAKEWVVIYKTRHENLEAIEAVFRSHHPYDVPCIVNYEAKANKDYMDWVAKETQ